MHIINYFANRCTRPSARTGAGGCKTNATMALIAASVVAGAFPQAASAATVSQSVVVHATPSEVWSLIGPFCAIEQWLPPVGSCRNDGGDPLIRTLVTKDGQATFIEQQTARDEARFFYSYTFLSSPLPLTNYSSTIRVTAGQPGQATVTWSGNYTPDAGMDKDAADALDGIYAAGLNTIRDLVEQRFAQDRSSGVSP